MAVGTILPVLPPSPRYPQVAVVRLLSPQADLAQPPWQNLLTPGNSSLQNKADVATSKCSRAATNTD